MPEVVEGEYGFGLVDDKRLVRLQSLGLGLEVATNFRVNLVYPNGDPYLEETTIEIYKDDVLYKSAVTDTGTYNFYMHENDTYVVRTSATHPLRHETVEYAGEDIEVDFIILGKTYSYRARYTNGEGLESNNSNILIIQI